MSFKGPLIGSELYKIGGFTLPFFSVGAFATVMSFVLCAVVPDVGANDDISDAKNDATVEKKDASFTSLLRVTTQWQKLNTFIETYFYYITAGKNIVRLPIPGNCTTDRQNVPIASLS